MTTLITNQSQWQSILRQQKLANAQRWLNLLEQSPDPTETALREYDNLFKAFEYTLLYTDTLDLAYRYIIILHPIVYGFADWERWLSYLEQALHLSRQAQKPQIELHIKELSADFLLHLGFPKKAIKYFEEIKNDYEDIQDLNRLARVLTKLANENSRYGDVVLARNYLNQAVKIANDLEDKNLLALVYLDLSAFEARIHNWEKGLDASQYAYELYQELNIEHFMIRALMNKVACLAHLGRWEDVNALSETLAEKMDMASDQINLIKLKNNLGLAALNQEDFKTAEFYWQEALQLAEQVNAPIEMGFLYCNLGVVYNNLEEWEYAEKMHHEALLTFTKLGDTANWASAVENLAELYEAQGRTTELKQLLSRAIKKLKPSKSVPAIHAYVTQFESLLAELE